ncbi:MAG: S-layer homology domain-containing protein, partial [Clostridiales bacterium]
MKKLVTVLLIAVMVFGLATSAFAYTDTKDLDAKIQDAITKLSALDVVNGYPDGSFGVNKDISRSEFAKVACNLAGLGDAADNLKGTKSRFKDVPANQWYTGWVNLATAQGFVNGYPDGTFKPNAPITMQEVVTVLLRIAGYDDNLPGPWPFDYIAQASKVDVTKDIKFVSSGKSTRGDVASMGSNLLDVKAVYWNSDKAKFENIDDKKDLTVLEDSFGAVVEAGYVDGITKATTENEKFALKKESAWTVENFAKDVLALNLDAKSYDLAKTYAFETGYNLSNIAGHQVKVILNDDKDIVYVDVKSSIVKGDKATIDGSKIKIGGRSYAVVAFDVNDKADGMGNYINTYEAKDNNVEAYAYLNNDDQVYAVVSDKKVTINSDKNTLVDSVDVEKGRIEAIMGSTFSNLTKDDVYVIKDGVKASLKDIKQFDLIQSLKDTGDADKILLVQTPVTGKLTRVYGNTHATLANTKYPVASPHYFVEDADTTDVALADYLGKDVNYVLNGANEILAVVAGEGASASKWNYGVVTDLTLKQERD